MVKKTIKQCDGGTLITVTRQVKVPRWKLVDHASNDLGSQLMRSRSGTTINKSVRIGMGADKLQPGRDMIGNSRGISVIVT
jgi:hypothetical protein